MEMSKLWACFGIVLLVLANLVAEGWSQGQDQDQDGGHGRGQGQGQVQDQDGGHGRGQGQGQDQDGGQGQDTSSSSCLNQLAPCLYYLSNGGRDVPDSCCDPLKYVIKSRPECLCNMISNKGSREAERAGINITEAQMLPGRCGQHVNPLACLSGSPSSKSSAEGSQGILLLPSITTIMAVAICMLVHNLWVYIY